MSKPKMDDRCSEYGTIRKKTEKLPDNPVNILDFVGAFGVYQKRLYIIPYEPVIWTFGYKYQIST